MARYVRVASISFSGSGRGRTPEEKIKENLKEIIALLERAALDNPDIVCLPECSPMLGLSHKEFVKMAEEIPGPIFKAVANVAKEHNMYVVCPMIERKSGLVYNSAVLIGRDGEYVGSYHKIHPTMSEMEAGITPGTKPVTFNLDFGRVGFAICFDLNFEDVIKGLHEHGVELLFFPSMYPGGLQLRIWAFNYGIYIVSACTNEGSMIVDPLGRILTKSSLYMPIISKKINLDYEIFHLDYNWTKFNSIKKKYGANIEFEVTRPEATFMLASEMRDITIKDIIHEFNLETRENYFKRSTKIRDNTLKRLNEKL